MRLPRPDDEPRRERRCTRCSSAEHDARTCTTPGVRLARQCPAIERRYAWRNHRKNEVVMTPDGPGVVVGANGGGVFAALEEPFVTWFVPR